jgi:carbamoyl-phosphate synthase small subunit
LAIETAKSFPGLKGMDLAKEVTTQTAFNWNQGSWDISTGYKVYPNLETSGRYHVVAYDYGVKHNILRMLADRGCRLTVVPAQTSAQDVMALQPDGVFLSNGPGDLAIMRSRRFRNCWK